MIAPTTPIEYRSDILVRVIDMHWLPFQAGNGFQIPVTNPVQLRLRGATIQKQPKK